MSALRLKLVDKTAGRLDLSGLVPGMLSGLDTFEIARLPVSTSAQGLILAGDVFTISGAADDDGMTLTFEGTTTSCDGIGADLTGGAIIVEGDAGAYAARHMKAGRLDIRGNAGSWLASGMSGGVVTVSGSAGDYTGAMSPGEKFGMSGGTVCIEGDCGARAGDRMRRGTIIVKGRTGPAAGSRMAGGTIWTETGFGEAPGPLMRRGTLIGPKAERMLPTFSDCGRHDLVAMRLISRYVSETLGDLAPKSLPPFVRRYAGDLATIGKGEILLTA